MRMSHEEKIRIVASIFETLEQMESGFKEREDRFTAGAAAPSARAVAAHRKAYKRLPTQVQAFQIDRQSNKPLPTSPTLLRALEVLRHNDAPITAPQLSTILRWSKSQSYSALSRLHKAHYVIRLTVTNPATEAVA